MFGISCLMKLNMENKSQQKIIGFKTDITTLEHSRSKLLEDSGIKIKKPLPLINACVCDVKDSSISYKVLSEDPLIEFVEDDHILDIQVMPSDSWLLAKKRQDTPWGIKKIGAPKVWRYSKGKGVKVGIIDTGIDLSHPDLKDNIKETYGVLTCKNIDDDNGHGTHVAGTIAAIDNNIGVIGVSPEIEIYSAKAFNRRGRGRVSHIIESVTWCIKKKVDIINMSFGFSIKSIALEKAIKQAHRHNILMVAAAGNSGGENKVMYPAKYSEVLAVAASDRKNNIASFSSGGPEVDIIAPGVDITSTYKGGKYRRLSGTSMAAPHVTGAAALMISLSKLKPKHVKMLLSNTAQDLGYPKEKQGAGLINVSRAVFNNKKRGPDGE